MERYKNETIFYEMQPEEDRLHGEIIISVYNYLVKAGYRTFSLTSEQFDHLKYLATEVYAVPKEEEIIVEAEKSTVINDSPEIYEVGKSKGKRKPK